MAAVIAPVACVAVAACDDVVDYFVEGDCDPWYVEAGRYEGIWKFEGDPRELEEFARGLERIEFRVQAPLPGSWRGKRSPEGSVYLTRDNPVRGLGYCVIDGREYAFRLLLADPHDCLCDGWLQFDEELPFLTERAYGHGFGILLEAKRDPARDWLYLWLGRNPDGSAWGFPYTRAD